VSERWYFHLEGETVVLRARLEGDGLLGDAFSEIRPGQNALGLSYEELRAAGAGTVVIRNGKARIAV
jgi:hypothetical protein